MSSPRYSVYQTQKTTPWTSQPQSSTSTTSMGFKLSNTPSIKAWIHSRSRRLMLGSEHQGLKFCHSPCKNRSDPCFQDAQADLWPSLDRVSIQTAPQTQVLRSRELNFHHVILPYIKNGSVVAIQVSKYIQSNCIDRLS